MTKNRDWKNFYVPAHYQAPLVELQGKLPVRSFSKAMQGCLRLLFKRYGVDFTEKPGEELFDVQEPPF